MVSSCLAKTGEAADKVAADNVAPASNEAERKIKIKRGKIIAFAIAGIRILLATNESADGFCES